jgi:hypothetical protein
VEKEFLGAENFNLRPTLFSDNPCIAGHLGKII